MPDPVVTDLAEQVRTLAAAPEHLARRALWESLHDLTPPRALVSFTLYTGVWEREIAASGEIVHAPGVARDIEVQLRARLWKAAAIPDDEPLLPTVWLGMPRPADQGPLWGVDLPFNRPAERGAYKPEPPLREEADLARIVAPRYAEDTASRDRLLADARELIGDVLPVKLHTDELHYGPFEWAVRMRGMDALLLDVYDRPYFAHALMERITDGMVGYHRQREAAGAVDAEASWGFHMYWDRLAPGAGSRLRDCWAYAHAQSSASFSPRMYAEFVQPYNVRIAELFGRVYYHGCEDLSARSAIIRDLPNLRMFHVGPWTPLEPVVRNLGGRCALEVHSHPTNVLFTFSNDDMRREIADLHRAAQGVPHVLKLCDVETLGGRAERLRAWTDAARDVVEG